VPTSDTGHSDRWREGLGYEVSFWQRSVRTRGAEWPEDFVRRVASEQQVTDPLLLECLRRFETGKVTVLDVGAVPISLVGTSAPSREINLTATDPLAAEYAGLLADAGITPPVPTELCHGERLLERFARDSFDVAYARNSLDHSYDPQLIVENMVSVVRPGGFVILRHKANEGERESYSGLHQWNFDVESGRLVIWNARGRSDVLSTVTAPTLQWTHRNRSGWVVSVIKRDAGGGGRYGRAARRLRFVLDWGLRSQFQHGFAESNS
jgi:SAM-dependent methyltransferase